MKKITVLMIGNSFSVDAARYTHELSLGSEVEIELGVLYVGGCSLEQHIGFIKKGSSPYEWFVNGESTGRYINELIEYVRRYQKESVLVLHKTWPYQTGFENTNFEHYNYDRKTMYKCICDTYNYVSKDLVINIIIRSGDSIEAAIEKYGEHFHKDGFHLNDVGRYIAALTFVHTFNNNQMIKNLYVPEFLDEKTAREYEELVQKTLLK